jgi:hypothetical protein
MTFNDFINKYLGKKVDYDGAYAGQCVDLFRQYNKDVLGLKVQPKGVSGAKDFWYGYDNDPVLKANFKKIPNSPTGVPAYGDVIIWDKWSTNPYGHIAIFIRGDVNKFTSLDQNFPTLSKVTETEHSYTNPKVLGWLRPTSDCENKIKQIEEDVRLLQQSLTKKQTEIDTLKAENLKLVEDSKLLNKIKNGLASVTSLFKK